MQSVPITTDVVSSNLDHERCTTLCDKVCQWLATVGGLCTTFYDKVCQWFATDRWFSSGPPVSSINKTDSHDITEIFLKGALNTIKQTKTNLLCVFTVWVPCCDVSYDFRIKTMCGSSLPPVVCRRVHVLFMFVCLWCPTHIVLCFCLFVFVLCTICCQFLWIVHCDCHFCII